MTLPEIALALDEDNDPHRPPADAAAVGHEAVIEHARRRQAMSMRERLEDARRKYQ